MNLKNNPNPNKIDTVLDAWNKKLATFFGNKNTLLPKYTPSNLHVIVLIVVCTLFLWLLTGIYYLSNNKFGLILHNGTIATTVSGAAVNATVPYPWGNMVIFDTQPSKVINLSDGAAAESNIIMLSKDLVPFNLQANFIYQIVSPVQLFRQLSNPENHLDQIISEQVKADIHNVFLDQLSDNLIKSNLTLLSSAIKIRVNANIAPWGLKLVKLNINTLTQSLTMQGTESPVTATIVTPVLATQLLSEAQAYKNNLLNQTQSDINNFNLLLMQYQQTPLVIVQQMYYATQASIPYTPTESYPLLDLPLSSLLNMSQQDSTISAPIDSYGLDKKPHRLVERFRHFRIVDDDE